MKISSNIAELIQILSKYSLPSIQEDYLNYLFQAIEFLTNDDQEIQAFRKEISSGNLLANTGEAFGKQLSVSDSVKILRIARKMTAEIKYESRYMIPSLMYQLFPNNFRFSDDLVQIFSNVTSILRISEDTMSRIQTLRAESFSNPTVRVVYFKSSPLELFEQARRSSYVRNNNVRGTIRVLDLDPHCCFVSYEGNDKVLINSKKITEKGVFLLESNEHLIINEDVYPFDEIIQEIVQIPKFKDIFVEATELSPKIVFNTITNSLEIIGKSYMEDPYHFYGSLIEWLDIYLSSKPKNVTMIFQLEYFNTSSSKVFLEILRKMEKYYENGGEISCDWYYSEEDLDLLEAGETYSEIVTVPFKMLVRKSYFNIN